MTNVTGTAVFIQLAQCCYVSVKYVCSQRNIPCMDKHVALKCYMAGVDRYYCTYIKRKKRPLQNVRCWCLWPIRYAIIFTFSGFYTYYIIAPGVLLLIDNITTWLAVDKRNRHGRIYTTGTMLLCFCKICLFATQYSLYGQTRSFEVLYGRRGPILLHLHQTEETPITKCKVLMPLTNKVCHHLYFLGVFPFIKRVIEVRST